MSNAQMRLGNKITVLVPANKYELNCAWTEEDLLPALELFTCKLLLVLEKVSPSEVSGYFGLNTRETEQLISNLMSNKLISLDSEGLLIPTSVLRKQSTKGEDVVLTNYIERNETVIFDSLTHSIRKDRGFNYRLIGLPELSIESSKPLKLEDAISNFSAQYKMHLNLSRKTERERNRTKLYKVVSGINRGTVQFPVDIEFHYLPSELNQHEVKRISRASEFINNGLELPLSVSLEAHIADYLGSIPRSKGGIDAEEYCRLVKDEVLEQFTNGEDIDYSGWLNARNLRKTGYGSQATRSIFGPIYLDNNQVTIMKMFNEAVNDLDESKSTSSLNAYWLPSDVGLWGANNQSLSTFCEKIKKALEKHHDISKFIAVHHGENIWDGNLFRSFHSKHIPNGIMTANNLNRMEIFLIPGVLGVVQYHGYPNSNSGVSVPIGYVTIDLDRLDMLEELLKERLGNTSKLKVSWPKKMQLHDLLDPTWNLDALTDSRISYRPSRKPILKLSKD